VHDCHAEVLAKRGFQLYLISEINKILQGEIVNSILELNSNGRIVLKSKYSLTLFITKAPCGECSIINKADECGNKMAETGAKLLSEFFTQGIVNNSLKKEGILRTKPYRSDTPIKNRSCSLSCSDKIMLWNIVGVQGALLSNFIEPIYIKKIVIYDNVAEDDVRRGVSIEQRLGKPKIEREIFYHNGKRIGASFQV